MNSKNKTSKYYGISYRKTDNTWVAQSGQLGKITSPYIASYCNEDEAFMALREVEHALIVKGREYVLELIHQLRRDKVRRAIK